MKTLPSWRITHKHPTRREVDVDYVNANSLPKALLAFEKQVKDRGSIKAVNLVE